MLLPLAPIAVRRTVLAPAASATLVVTEAQWVHPVTGKARLGRATAPLTRTSSGRLPVDRPSKRSSSSKDAPAPSTNRRRSGLFVTSTVTPLDDTRNRVPSSFATSAPPSSWFCTIG